MSRWGTSQILTVTGSKEVVLITSQENMLHSSWQTHFCFHSLLVIHTGFHILGVKLLQIFQCVDDYFQDISTENTFKKCIQIENDTFSF